MPGQFCHSCTAPLDVPQFKSAAKEYCVHCVDESGKLLPQPTVLDGIAHWLKSWQGKISDSQARERAGHFMKAMPAWAQPPKAAAKKKAHAGKPAPKKEERLEEEVARPIAATKETKRAADRPMMLWFFPERKRDGPQIDADARRSSSRG